MVRREAVLTACAPDSLARYVTFVEESSKQANVSSLMIMEACGQWQDAESCSTTLTLMSAIFNSI